MMRDTHRSVAVQVFPFIIRFYHNYSDFQLLYDSNSDSGSHKKKFCCKYTYFIPILSHIYYFLLQIDYFCFNPYLHIS